MSYLPDVVRDIVTYSYERLGRFPDIRDMVPASALATVTDVARQVVNYRTQFGNAVSSLMLGPGSKYQSALLEVGIFNQEIALKFARSFTGAAIPDAMLPASFSASLAERYLADMKAALEAAESFTGLRMINIETAMSVAKMVDAETRTLAGLLPASQIGRAASLAVSAFEAETNSVRSAELTVLSVGRLPIAATTTVFGVRAAVAIARDDDSSVFFDSLDLPFESAAVIGSVNGAIDIRGRLLAIPGGSKIVEKWDGGWEVIHSGGKNAGSMAAHRFVEVVDKAIRLLAPDADVFEWRKIEGRPDSDFSENGNLTRSCRMAFIVRNDPGRRSALKAYVKSLELFLPELQGAKHQLEVPDAASLVWTGLMLQGFLEWLLP